MPVVELYAYLLEKKLVTPLFAKPRDSPPLPGFDSSKKCEYHFNNLLIKTHPKHVPSRPKVSSFHLDLSHSKTQAFICPKID